MTGRQWAAKLNVSDGVIWEMGGPKRLEAMTDLGRELYLAVCFRAPGEVARKAAAPRIARENRERRKRERKDQALQQRRGEMLLRMRGVTPDLVWLGHPGLKKLPQNERDVARGTTRSAEMPCSREPSAVVDRMLALAGKVA